MKQVLEHLLREKKESELIHHPQGYSWEGVEAFYLWKHRTPVPQVNSEGWKTRAEELETLLSDYSEFSEQVHHQKATMLVLQASTSLPAYVPTLNQAEMELKQAISLRPESSEYHSLPVSYTHLRAHET